MGLSIAGSCARRAERSTVASSPALDQAVLVAWTGPESGDPATTQLLKAIAEAASSIDFATVSADLRPDVIAALERAKERGVALRGIVQQPREACRTFGAAATNLASLLAPDALHCIRPAGRRGHLRFLVVDESSVWLGGEGAIETPSGSRATRDDLTAWIRSASLANLFRNEIRQLDGEPAPELPTAIGGPTHAAAESVRVFFSPAQSGLGEAIQPMIESARQRLDIAVLHLQAPPTEAVLAKALRRGVQVRVLVDACGAITSRPALEALCAGGAHVKVDDTPVGMQGRWAVADSRTADAQVVFGSMAWSTASDTGAVEQTVWLRDGRASDAVGDHFDARWRQLGHVASCDLAAPACPCSGASANEKPADHTGVIDCRAVVDP
ncbi:MAG TPA: phospholipase D-like domain-containing protein [Polyangiales bacterium]|nr:phospholipase D-like domain-containing protein [Polyangiales bacterium]